MQHSQLSRGRTRQDHPDHAGKCQQQLAREFSPLRKRVGQRLKARRLSQSRRASAASHRRGWRGSEEERGGDGGKGGGEKKKPPKKKKKFWWGLFRGKNPLRTLSKIFINRCLHKDKLPP